MKIGFCGTMSVGKTTLVNALAELPEFKDYKSTTERSKYLMELGIPLNKNSEFKKGYFLSGIEYDEATFKEIMKEREGLPWYKQSAPKGETYRN